MKTGRKTLLTPEIQRKIVAYIRAGAFDHVAAQACRIPSSTFYRWMADGREGKAEYREFWEEVMTARAEARAVAETEVRKESPFNWLRYGPGRDRPGEPGWTETVHAEPTGAGGGPIQVQNYREEFIKRIERLARRNSTRGIAGQGPPPPL